jgi:P-type E1-E2 ATPase
MEQIEKFRDDEKSLRNLYRNMETSLIPLGCTGVEDKLQEGVPETLESLQKAGIRILMLTGDKLETAVSVAVSCGLLDNSDDSKKLTIISEAKNVEQVGDKLKEIK